MTILKAIVATPSPLQRARLAKALSACPGLQVVAQTADLSQTYTEAEARPPDVVILAQEFLGLEEFATMTVLFQRVGAAWLTIADGTGHRAGGLGNSLTSSCEPSVSLDMDAATLMEQVGRAVQSRRRRAGPEAPAPGPVLQTDRVILIGASTGGVDALLEVLGGFPADCPPTAIVQHTGQGFTDSLIRVLDRGCAARVVAAFDGMMLRPGLVGVAGGTAGHLRLASGTSLRCSLAPGEPISGHRPSVDALFLSAVSIAPRVVAALLTGMGKDGAAGLLELRRAGARTIGQDAATSVVYGMPRAAWELGAVQQQMPIGRIGPELIRLCGLPPDTRGERT